jgi:adenosylcobinamide-phosphate synthase
VTILLALLWDWFVGEPPLWGHPVVWCGNYLKWAERSLGRKRTVFWGGLAWWSGVILVGVIVGGMTWAIGQLPQVWQILFTALLLKPAFAFRMLVREVTEIEAALVQDLDLGRQRLAYIVSRDTTVLSPIEVRESALESISENLSDSVIAPLFWFLVAGLPGAYVYRFVNTADAMWGYRDAKYEKWGKIAARMDDVMNWIPARLTGLWLLWFPGCGLLKTQLLVTNIVIPPSPANSFGEASPTKGGDMSNIKVPLLKGDLGGSQYVQPTIQQLHAESRKTPSPNSGWSMAAFALRLGVHLGKPGVYVLNPQGADVDAELAIAGIRWITRSGWVLALIMAGLGALRFEFTGWLYG